MDEASATGASSGHELRDQRGTTVEHAGDQVALTRQCRILGPLDRDAIGVQFSLWESTSGADFDVGLYDPDTGQYIAWWETSNHPETGAFTIWGPGKDVHLVVSPFLGESAYRLEIYVYPACCPDRAAPGAVEADGAPMSAGIAVDERGGALAAPTAPVGYFVTSFATGVGSPTALGFGPDGWLYVTRLDGQVSAMKDLDGNGAADTTVTFASGFV